MNRTCWSSLGSKGDGLVKNLVIVCLSPQSQEIWEHIHVISPSRRLYQYLLEAKNQIPSDLTNLSPFFDCIVEHLGTCATLTSSASSSSSDFSEPASDPLSLEKLQGMKNRISVSSSL